MRWRRSWSGSGGAHLEGGAFAEAQACFREEVALRERLVAAQPGQRRGSSTWRGRE